MNKLTNLQHEAHQISLSAQERALLRSQIFAEPKAVASYTVSHWSFFSIKFAPVMAAVLIVLLSGGTAYAAQAALPGELLYAVKVKVNEPVREVLAVSTEAKAAFHTSVAQTRLEEAEVLAAEGRLDAAISAEIEERLEVHLARAEEVKERLEKEEKAELAVEVEAELDSALAAHSAILAKLGEESDDDETREHSRSLAGRITSRIFAKLDTGAGATMAMKTAAPAMESVSLMAADASSTSEMALMATNTAEEAEADERGEGGDEAEQRAAEALKQRAQKQVAAAQAVFDDLKSGLEATTTARVEAQFKTLEDQMREGEALYKEENYAAARATFNTVIRDTIELNAYLYAEKRFNKKYLRSWVDTRFGEWFEAEVRGLHTDDHNDEDGDDDNDDNRDEDEDEKDDDSRSGVEINLGL